MIVLVLRSRSRSHEDDHEDERGFPATGKIELQRSSLPQPGWQDPGCGRAGIPTELPSAAQRSEVVRQSICMDSFAALVPNGFTPTAFASRATTAFATTPTALHPLAQGFLLLGLRGRANQGGGNPGSGGKWDQTLKGVLQGGARPGLLDITPLA